MTILNKTVAAIILFFVSVLVLTRMDYIVHQVLYNYGLVFSYAWASDYWILYALCYQLVILFLFLWTQNKKLLIATEAFVLTATQDLIFFGLWCGWFPTTDWVWMPQYVILGFWSTQNQWLLSVVVNFTILSYFTFLELKQKKLKFP